MKKRVVVINTEKGVFLGSLAGYALFSSTDPIGMHCAYSFSDVDTAKQFVSKALPSMANNMIYPVIPSGDDYVSCVDIIRSGYGDYTHHMIDHLPMISDTIH